MATVRFFAAAADVVGSESLTLPVSTVAELRTTVQSRFGASATHVIAQCAVLVNGQRVDDDTVTLSDEDTVDVLPPFAGG